MSPESNEIRDSYIILVAEIRLAARLVFDSEVARLQDDDIIALVEQWQHRCRVLITKVVNHI